ncbi:MAG: ATP-binding cassette domain-containing protein, partial [Myxococcota bacterium]|nr:ATP-binding cassette domain-containing protein [Myxococcota bacterium]
MSETSRDVVRIRALNKYYGRGKTRNHVLKDVNLRISAGEIVSIIGTSGSGKTTLLNIIGGLDGDFEGVVEIASQNLHGLSDRQLSRLRNRTLGFVFQTFNLLPHVSCLENVMVPAYFSDIPWGRSRERAEELVRMVGLEEKMHERPTELSGGQRQRVAIARAMF